MKGDDYRLLVISVMNFIVKNYKRVVWKIIRVGNKYITIRILSLISSRWKIPHNTCTNYYLVVDFKIKFIDKEKVAFLTRWE